MAPSRWRCRIVAAVALAFVAPLVGTTTAGAAPGAGATASAAPGQPNWQASGLQPTGQISAAKSESGKLAQTDPALLGRTDSTPVDVLVKLDYDATASYAGGVDGLAATSPTVTGQKLTGNTPAEKAYESYTQDLSDSFTAELHKRVPSAKVGENLQRVYGGVAIEVPANQVATVLGINGVAAVQQDKLEQPLTDSSTFFIGAPTVWSQEGGQALAGKGVIFGSLDTGVWPEHPSFTDNGTLPAPPPTADGHARACNFGDNPLTPASDVFVCNDKLIGGQPFIATYNRLIGHEVYPNSARDSEGHGTHTTSTAAGDIVQDVPLYGVNRGPISGVAPGAYVMVYKVCGLQGCFQSDSVKAVEQAIVDGVNVINFSISGGSNPSKDPVELAFLDAYAAGVFVAASAGNSGPGAGTAEHLSPWVTTVGASTQQRAFQSTITVTDAAASATFVGSSITGGISTPSRLVIPTTDQLCQKKDYPPTTFTGAIVVCKRGGNARVEKGFNVLHGGAAGMILYNQPLADTETDNHWLPAVHLADGTQFLAFLAAHPNATATFTAGQKAQGQGDVMAAFSSRGGVAHPSSTGAPFLKPDITAPGVQILAGNTPTPDQITDGPPGNYFQAIAGTSMSSPHVAGSALLLKALHPTWTPADIKSALETTAKTSVVKEDLTTPADPFDMGGGRVDLTVAGNATLSFPESAGRMAALVADPVGAVNVNVPSVDVATMPGKVIVTRTVKNVGRGLALFRATTNAPVGATISVSPAFIVLPPGRSTRLHITISSLAANGQYFGQINFVPFFPGAVPQHMPVAFFKKQGNVTLQQSCDASSIARGASTGCTVNVANETFADVTVHPTSTVSTHLRISDATGATVKGRRASPGDVTLKAMVEGTPHIGDGQTPAGGYLDLASLGVAPTPIGDEALQSYPTPTFLYDGNSYNQIGVVSNGYVIMGPGTGTAQDISFKPQTLPDPAPPNNEVAPYWTDLDGTGSPGVRVATLSDGTHQWVVAQWNVHLFGDTSAAGQRNFQVWIGLNGTQDVSIAWDSTLAPAPPALGLTIGAENSTGTGGSQLAGLPPVVGGQAQQVVTSTLGRPGGTLNYGLTLTGQSAGSANLTTTMPEPDTAGTSIVQTPITVTAR